MYGTAALGLAALMAAPQVATAQDSDQVIVTGFSRGAAIARRFCAKLNEKSSHLNSDIQPFVYLAVFDTVASIGLPNLSQSERPDYDVVFEHSGHKNQL